MKTEHTIDPTPESAETDKITVPEKPIIKKPAVAKNKIAVKGKNFKRTSKKMKKMRKIRKTHQESSGSVCY